MKKIIGNEQEEELYRLVDSLDSDNNECRFFHSITQENEK